MVMIITKKNKKTTLLITILAALLIIASVAAYFFFFKKADTFQGTAGVSKVNYGPPTEQEKKAGDAQKKAVVEQDKLDNQGTPANTNADIFISDASYYSDDNMVEVRGYVTNVYENGGTCTATFTQGSQSVSTSSTGFQDAKTTQCGILNIARSKFATAGTWNLTLTYSSPTAQGSKTSSIKL
jgi:hypothetical protein